MLDDRKQLLLEFLNISNKHATEAAWWRQLDVYDRSIRLILKWIGCGWGWDIIAWTPPPLPPPPIHKD